LLVLDVDRVRGQYQELQRALPGVALYYAVKSLPAPDIVACLDAIGCHFDLASSGEIRLVEELQISARRTIHTHPIKRDDDIRTALRFGCTTFVVDNRDELLKFRPYRRRVGLLLRIAFRSPAAVVDLSKKFGCEVDEASQLLELGARLGIHIKGLCFHVGSQCRDTRRQVEAVDACHTPIRQHHDTGAAPLSILDIGGGFPVAYGGAPVDIQAYCAPLRQALAQLSPHVNVFAEPGRFLSAPAVTGIATVIGKARRDGRNWYYLDDGVYGSFSGQVYDRMRYPLEIFSDQRQAFPSVLAGPTCDSIDIIVEDLDLPELEIGDLVVAHMMGAYTMASATDFNLLGRARLVRRQAKGGPAAPWSAADPAVPSAPACKPH
jgi:ornithine decarboxylase